MADKNSPQDQLTKLLDANLNFNGYAMPAEQGEWVADNLEVLREIVRLQDLINNS